MHVLFYYTKHCWVATAAPMLKLLEEAKVSAFQ